MMTPPAKATPIQRTQTVCLVILTLIASGYALTALQTVILPFVIALFVVIGCQPILNLLETRLGLHWFLSFITTFVLGFVIMSLFALLTWLSIDDLTRNASAYQTRVNAVLDWVTVFMIDGSDEESTTDPANDDSSPESESGDDVAEEEPRQPTPETDNEFQNSDSEPALTTAAEATEPAVLNPSNQAALTPSSSMASASQISASEPIDEELRQQRSAALADLFSFSNKPIQNLALNMAGTLSLLFSYGILVLIFVFFLLLGRATSTIASPAIVKQVEDEVRKYIVLKTFISILTGLATSVVLWLFGVPLAIVFGFLAFLLNFIPNIGPLIVCALPIPFLVLNSEMSPAWAIVCFVLICAVQFLSGNVFEPRIMGKSFDLSPVVLLMALMFFGLVWGIVGMFLATPLVSIVKIILQQYEATRPIANLMAGRWDKSLEHLGGKAS